MNRTLTLTIAVALLTTSFACGGDDGPDNPEPQAGEVVESDKQRITQPDIAPDKVDQQVDGNTDFTFDLYRAIAERKAGENVIYSPYSVSVALAMTYAGARSQTEQDMASTMHYVLPQDDLHPAFNSLDLALESRGEGAEGQDDEPFRLRIANSIWGQDGFSFEQPFLDTLALNYGAGLRLLDFAADPEAARQTINDWVEWKTEERIKDLLPQGSIRPSTRLVLTNAIYFNAAWKHKFDEDMTQKGDFTTADESTVQADMMTQMEDFEHASLDGMQAIELPYDGDDVSMLFVIPDDLSSTEAGIGRADIEAIDAALSTKKVELTMPKFEFTTPTKLTEIFREDLGMESAFIGADFSGMSTEADLAITDILHKAFILLDESGTEAAAATAVVVGETSEPTADVVLTIDRPFLFFIRDNPTGSILFAGRVLDPTAE
ncbi:MAG: serpin family protein [Myxococcota bacterium]